MERVQDIVGKLWYLCGILREAGITYPEYVTELTYLIFLKMAQETGSENSLPRGFRWNDLASRSGTDQFRFYTELLERLGTKTKGSVREIFRDAETCLSHSKYLSLLVTEFDKINWYGAREEGALADLYEGLLDKNSTESKSGAGQYFTPRSLIDSMVEVIKPRPGEVVQDPACGTAGFLIAADRYIKKKTSDLKGLTLREVEFQRKHAFVGVELVPQTRKLALMNAMLHGIQGTIIQGDTLSDAGESLAQADVIMTNPPFGTKRGAGFPTRSFPIPTSNKQLAFLQHIYLGLKPGGRAAVVMPDLQGTTAPRICDDLMEKCRLHTILRLPMGIFYAPGVRTNVLFFTRGVSDDSNNTKEVWIYDLRSDIPRFGKRTPLERSHFKQFERAYGAKPDGTSQRKGKADESRFRCFTREDIRGRGNNLFFTWDGNETREERESISPEALARNIEAKVKLIFKELAALRDEVTPRR